jgi:hypothetical protein
MMPGTIERACFLLCLALGWLLRCGRYSSVRIVDDAAGRRVAKHRRFYAPVVVWIGGQLMWLLDTGVRVLPQRAWQERERRLYWTLYGSAIRIDADGTLLLPWLAGESLATLLENRELAGSMRTTAIELAAVALADFHRGGFTHGDAMAENVMIDRESGIARWFDFETIHESGRTIVWQRADDVRALLFTCLRRQPPELHAATFQLIVEAYGDDEVASALAAGVRPVLRRSLAFHLAQAPLPFAQYRAIARLSS